MLTGVWGLAYLLEYILANVGHVGRANLAIKCDIFPYLCLVVDGTIREVRSANFVMFRGRCIPSEFFID
jgi:hypothetical protein